jgi:hypothetical protein
MIRRCALPALLMWMACARDPAPLQRAPTPNKEHPVTSTLAQRLTTDVYGPSFVWPQHDHTIAKIWSEPGNPAHLEALIDDRLVPPKARLLAAEALFKNDFTFLDRHDNTEIARIYADALAHHVVPAANVWGLLWVNERVGELGGRLIMLGEDAIPALRALLDDHTVVDWYEGSEEATLGNSAKYRVRDFAAFYLARITNHPIAFHPDFAARDLEIGKLITALDASSQRSNPR